MFRANDEQVSINDKLTREKFQTRVFHCLLNEISFVIIFPYNHDYRPHEILIPIFHLSYEFAIASTFFFFFDTNSYESIHNSFGVFLHGEVRSREAFL